MKKKDYVAHEIIGIYGRDIKMVNMAMCEQHEYAQCGFKVENGNLDFYSYSSLLFRLPLDSFKGDNRRTECHLYFGKVAPNYSRTTINHTRWFSDQLNLNAGYHMLKEIYSIGNVDCIVFADTEELKKILSLY